LVIVRYILGANLPTFVRSLFAYPSLIVRSSFAHRSFILRSSFVINSVNFPSVKE